jgi:hypothetical protein
MPYEQNHRIRFAYNNRLTSSNTSVSSSYLASTITLPELFRHGRKLAWYPSSIVADPRFTIDLGAALECTLIAMIPPSGTILKFSENASIIVKASNVNDRAAAPFTKTFTPTDSGVFGWLDDTETPNYRYWWIDIDDNSNINGAAGLALGYMYLGNHLDFTNRNLSNGFSLTRLINTKVETSEGGQQYYNKRPSQRRISNTNMRYMTGTDARLLDKMLYEIDIHTPMIVSLDPKLLVTPNPDDLTLYATIDGESNINHIINDYYSTVLTFKEVL